MKYDPSTQKWRILSLTISLLYHKLPGRKANVRHHQYGLRLWIRSQKTKSLRSEPSHGAGNQVIKLFQKTPGSWGLMTPICCSKINFVIR